MIEVKGLKTSNKIISQYQRKLYGIPIIISAPSGGGKTTICHMLLDELDNLEYSISCTTRPPRDNEIDGIHYHFITHKEFQKLLAEDKFIEHAKVHNYYYGTLKNNITHAKKNKKDLLLDIDVKGGKQIQQQVENGIYIFILPPSMEVLYKRLKKRHTESPKSLQTRLNNAKRELIALKDYQYIVINKDLDYAVQVIKNIILVEKSRIWRYHND